MVASLRAAGVSGVLSKADLPDGPDDIDLDALSPTALENLTLEEDGRYFPIYFDTDLRTAVRASSRTC